MMYRFLVSFSIFHEILGDFGPASRGTLPTSFYDHSGLPGARRASADVLGHSPRPLDLSATLPATGADPERIPRVDPVLHTGTSVSFTWSTRCAFVLRDVHPNLIAT